MPDGEEESMQPFHYVTTKLEIGAQEPFRILHVTDTHIARADADDDSRKQALARQRAAAFEGENPGCTERYFRESAAFANESGALLVHTGDLFDFVSLAHDRLAPELLKIPRDSLMAVGNHEFSLYVGEAFEDETYKAQSLARIERMLPGQNLRFYAREVNGVILVAMDNVYYDFTDQQREMLLREAEKGKPMLLFFHNPIYTPALYEEMRDVECCYAVGTPSEKMESYNDYRYRQQIATPQTRRFLSTLFSLKNVKAIFAGHLHRYHESPLENGVMQYITDAQYHNAARLIEVR